MVDLDDLFVAWDPMAGDGRDKNAARDIANAYVAEHPDDFAELEALIADLPGDEAVQKLVALVDSYREIGDVFREKGVPEMAREADENKLKVDVFLLHRVEFQTIGGGAQVLLRNPNG